MTLFAVGDSHSIFFWRSQRIKEHWLGFSSLPVTMWRVVHEGLPIDKVAEILGNGHERFPVLPTDTVLFFYGHNDVQKNVATYWKDTWQDELPRLADAYVATLTTLPCHPVVMAVYPVPRTVQPTFCGTDTERQNYTTCLNNALEAACARLSVQWLDLTPWVGDSEGYIDHTRDGHHLNYDDPELVERIESKILSSVSQHADGDSVETTKARGW